MYCNTILFERDDSRIQKNLDIATSTPFLHFLRLYRIVDVQTGTSTSRNYRFRGCVARKGSRQSIGWRGKPMSFNGINSEPFARQRPRFVLDRFNPPNWISVTGLRRRVNSPVNYRKQRIIFVIEVALPPPVVFRDFLIRLDFFPSRVNRARETFITALIKYRSSLIAQRRQSKRCNEFSKRVVNRL